MLNKIIVSHDSIRLQSERDIIERHSVVYRTTVSDLPQKSMLEMLSSNVIRNSFDQICNSVIHANGMLTLLGFLGGIPDGFCRIERMPDYRRERQSYESRAGGGGDEGGQG